MNALIKKYKYDSYLEIGVQFPENNFDKIIAKHKVCVDPSPPGYVTFNGTSDAYFDQLADHVKYGLIFIDGLHNDDQVLKDVDNSLLHLEEGGTIVCHDCLPTAEYQTTRENNDREWTGDVWKAIAKLRVERIDLNIKVVDTDWGCGIIRPGTGIPYQPNTQNYLTYPYYEREKIKMLNVITVEQFIKELENE